MTRPVGTALAVGAAALVGVLLRLPFITDPLEPDEAGYLLVARQWHPLDPHLYGRLWVDRPPLLLEIFRLADAWGPYGVRLVGLVAAAVLAAAAGLAGALVAGRRGAVTSALVAGALASSYAVGGQEVDGEVLGIPLVMTCCALTLLALRAPRRRAVALGVLAGVSGTAALLVKQNLADGLVFAFVLLVTTLLVERRAVAGRVLLAGVAGVAAVLLGVGLWSQLSGVGLVPLVATVYGFRAAADSVISGSDLTPPLLRAGLLLVLAMLSGIVAMAGLMARHLTPRLRSGDPLAVAVVVTALYGVVGIVAGGSYWPHYLIELVPVMAIGAALVGARRSVAGVVAAAVVATGVGVGLGLRTGRPEATATTTGRLLRQASRPGDGVVVTYGHANLVQESGLATPYPYLWSLPVRVRDPHLHRLDGLLAGPRAPTWVVEWDDFDAWGIDRSGRLAATVAAHYRPAAVVCGHRVWLHDGRVRHVARAAGPCGSL